MTEIDRRSLMTLAGAGLLMAGSARAQCPTTSEQSGSCPPHGQKVTDLKPDAQNGNVTAFVPEYICVLYIRFTEDRTLKIRTAHVKPDRPFDVGAVVKPILNAMHSNSNVSALKNKEDFEDFTFGSQHLIVMFVDNDPDNVGFDDRFGLDNIVRFTHYRGSNPSIPAKENHAFFNLKRLDFADQGPLRSTVAYQLEFWNTNRRGNKIDAIKECPITHFIYSMNIHLKMAVKKSGGLVSWVPMIVDPDTGNMGGQP